MDLRGRRGVVTGGGSGIGRELALEFGRRGGDLLLVGRREQPLRETVEMIREGGGTADVLAVDITADGAVDRVAATVSEVLGRVDLLVNNAGNVRAGRLEDVDVADVRAMIDLNLTAPILLTQAMLPALRAAAVSGGSVVLNIASGIALVGLPFYATYAATKSGLARFGEALRRELHGSGVHVASAYPGATATPMMASSETGDDLGFSQRPVSDVVAEMLTALANDEHEINTAPESRRAMQRLNISDPLAVDAALAPRLADMEAAVRHHRSI
jgi:short-subunit dehydrogenase